MNKNISILFKDCSKCRNYGLLVLRIGIAYLMITNHGWGKITGGPDRWTRVGEFGMPHLGITFLPVFWGFMAAFSESIGALLIGIGLCTRVAAGLLMITMIVAVNMHITTGEGSPELAFMYAIGCLALVISGGGGLSLDHYLYTSKK